MLFTAEGTLGMQLRSQSFYGAIAGGILFMNMKQTYVNTGGTGCCVFRFSLPENAEVSSFEFTMPEKKIASHYINGDEAAELETYASGRTSPLTLDEGGTLTAVIGVIKPNETLDISLTYIQRISPCSTKRITIPSGSSERTAADFELKVQLKWLTADGKISASGDSELITDGNTVYLTCTVPTRADITLELHADSIHEAPLFTGEKHSLLELPLRFEPQRSNNKHDCIFILDISKSMREAYEDVKNALLSCICALDSSESFNIVAGGYSPHLLSIGSLKASDSSKASAKRWLDEFRPSGEVQLAETVRFAEDMCSHKSDIFIITSSRFTEKDKSLLELNPIKCGALHIITSACEDFEYAASLAETNRGVFEAAENGNTLADGLCRSVSRVLLCGLEALCVKTDKNIAWNWDKKGMIYPWDRLRLCRISSVPLPNSAELNAQLGQETFKQKFDISPLPLRISDTLAAMAIIDDCCTDTARRERLSADCNIPARGMRLSMTVNSTDDSGNEKVLRVAAIGAKGANTDKPKQESSMVYSLLAKQEMLGNIGCVSEPAGRFIDRLTTHPQPSLFTLQLKKSVEFLLEFVRSGNYDELPDRILDVFEIWLELFRSDGLFAKKLEALVYMNRK